MFIYFIILIMMLVLLHLSNGKLTSNNKWFFYIILPMFLCFGLMTGSDWRSYEYEFSEFTWDSLSHHYGEIGYGLGCVIFKSLGLGFWCYTVIEKLLGYYIILYFFKKISQNNIWGLIYWVPVFGLFLLIDHPARNFLAISTSSFCIFYSIKQDFKKFLLFLIISCTFHLSSLIMFPLYFIVNTNMKKFYMPLLFGAVGVFLIATFLKQYLESVIPSFLFYRIGSYMFDEYEVGASPIIFAFIFILTLLGVLNFKRYIKIGNNYEVLMNFAIIYLYLFAFSNINNIFFRFPLFLSMPFSVYLGFLIKHNKVKFNLPTNFIGKYVFKYVKYVIIGFCFYYQFNLITKDYRYVPYSNICTYLFKDLPNFQYRDSYNPTYSPYR